MKKKNQVQRCISIISYYYCYRYDTCTLVLGQVPLPLSVCVRAHLSTYLPWTNFSLSLSLSEWHWGFRFARSDVTPSWKKTCAFFPPFISQRKHTDRLWRTVNSTCGQRAPSAASTASSVRQLRERVGNIQVNRAQLFACPERTFALCLTSLSSSDHCWNHAPRRDAQSRPTMKRLTTPLRADVSAVASWPTLLRMEMRAAAQVLDDEPFALLLTDTFQ